MKASTVSPSVAVNWNRAVQACKRWWPFYCKPIPLMGPFLTHLLAGLTLSNSRNTGQCVSGWSPQSPLPGFRIYPFLNVTEGHRCPQRHLWENKDSAITEVGQFTQEQAINCAFLNSLTLLRGEYTRGTRGQVLQTSGRCTFIIFRGLAFGFIIVLILLFHSWGAKIVSTTYNKKKRIKFAATRDIQEGSVSTKKPYNNRNHLEPVPENCCIGGIAALPSMYTTVSADERIMNH